MLGELVGKTCLVYIDDVEVWVDTPEEVLECTQEIIEHFASAGMRFNGAKCYFLACEIELLGHRIVGDHIVP